MSEPRADTTPIVLVVDDEVSLVAVLTELLGSLGLQVITAEDGLTALERCRAAHPDVVLTDLRMPGIDGLTLLERLRADDREATVVLMSAYGDMPELTRAVRLGAFDFLAKPFELDAAERVLARALEHRRLVLERRRRAADTQRLEAFGRAVNAQPDLEQLFAWVKAYLPGALGVRLFSLFTVDEASNRLVLASSNHVPLPAGEDLALDDLRGPMREAIERRAIVAVRDFEESPYGGASGASQRQRYVADHAATIPLVVRDKLIGVLNLNDKRRGPLDGSSAFDALDQAFFTIAAEHLASAIAVRQQAAALMRALRELESAQERLIISEKLAAVSKLVAGVAHEIKNPLTSMYFAAVNLGGEVRELTAATQVSPERAERFIDTLQHDIARLRDRIDALMMFARPTAHTRRVIDPDGVVSDVVEGLGARAAAGGVSLTVSSGGGRSKVLVDVEGFHEAVTNLVVNALEASPTGGRVSVKLKRDNAGFCLQVEDTGPGIAPQLSERVFELFFTTKPKGSGVGLSQVHVICDTHGGSVRFTRADELTRFELRLPEHADEPAVAPA